MIVSDRSGDEDRGWGGEQWGGGRSWTQTNPHGRSENAGVARSWTQINIIVSVQITAGAF